MLPLAASIIAPVAGASLYSWLHNQPRYTRIFDAFMYVCIPVLALWQVGHMAAEEAGWIVFGVMGVGAAIPVAVERISNNFYAHTDNVALTLGVSGLLVHAALEGAALVSGGTGFRLALIAHRLLVGLMIWWLLRPRHGPLIASLGILTLVIATAAGYAVGSHMFGHGAGSTFYQAFVAGMLVHVVFCQCRGDHQH